MKLVYDINSVPKSLGIANMVKILENHRIVFWDSDLGSKPKFFAGKDSKDEADVLIVDTTGREVDVEFYESQYKEKEFWERELHNCKNSPTYFFTNYGTPTYPHTSEGLREFMASLKLEDLTAEFNSNDSDAAKEAWDLQKKKFKEGMSFITIDLLKERKAVVAAMKEEYDFKVKGLEEKLKSKVRLFDEKNIPLPEKTRVGHLVTKIKKVLPVHPAYSETYRTKKGKWDLPVLFLTDYDVLLQMLDKVLSDEIQ